jgi:hypothetical protein
MQVYLYWDVSNDLPVIGENKHFLLKLLTEKLLASFGIDRESNQMVTLMKPRTCGDMSRTTAVTNISHQRCNLPVHVWKLKGARNSSYLFNGRIRLGCETYYSQFSPSRLVHTTPRY